LIAVVSRNNKQVLILLGKWNKKKETAEHSILSSNRVSGASTHRCSEKTATARYYTRIYVCVRTPVP